jgi:hypothetical protein
MDKECRRPRRHETAYVHIADMQKRMVVERGAGVWLPGWT